MPRNAVKFDGEELGIKPNGYVGGDTDEETGHGRRKFDGQSIHGDTVSVTKQMRARLPFSANANFKTKRFICISYF